MSNSAKATSGINGLNTTVQKCEQIDDSRELFEADTLRFVSHGLGGDDAIILKLFPA